ncbi:MAG: hypothetical protein ACR5KX_06685 [Wolbachia sp.]
MMPRSYSEDHRERVLKVVDGKKENNPAELLQSSSIRLMITFFYRLTLYLKNFCNIHKNANNTNFHAQGTAVQTLQSSILTFTHNFERSLCEA